MSSVSKEGCTVKGQTESDGAEFDIALRWGSILSGIDDKDSEFEMGAFLPDVRLGIWVHRMV